MTAVLYQHTFSAHRSFQEAAFLGRVISVCPGFKTTEGGWQPPFSPLYDVFSYKGRNCSLPGFCLSAAQMQAVPCAHSHPHDSHGHGDPPRPLTSGGLTRGGAAGTRVPKNQGVTLPLFGVNVVHLTLKRRLHPLPLKKKRFYFEAGSRGDSITSPL